jgi:hypothetical protein
MAPATTNSKIRPSSGGIVSRISTTSGIGHRAKDAQSPRRADSRDEFDCFRRSSLLFYIQINHSINNWIDFFSCSGHIRAFLQNKAAPPLA